MASQAPATSALSPKLQQRLEAHKEEVARLREEFGDPAASLDKLILEVFDVTAFLPEERTRPDEPRPIWEEDDDSSAW